MNKEKILSFYCDIENPQTHLTGYIDSFNSDDLLIRHVTPSGFYDGFILIRRSDLFRIDSQGKYEDKIEFLYKYRGQSHPSFTTADDLLSSVLDFAQTNSLVTSIEIPDTILTGFICEHSNEQINVLLIDKYGDHNGNTIISSADIISVAVDSMVEQDIKILYESKER